MPTMKVYRVCTDCPIHHYENCDTCAGFGVYPGKTIPVVPIWAGEAHDGTYPDNWLPCPECGSTPMGPPIYQQEVRDLLAQITEAMQRLLADVDGVNNMGCGFRVDVNTTVDENCDIRLVHRSEWKLMQLFPDIAFDFRVRIVGNKMRTCPSCGYTAEEQVKHRHPSMDGLCGVGRCVVNGTAWLVMPSTGEPV